MPGWLFPALLIFLLRITDITLYTLRIRMVMRGMRVWAWIFGFMQAIVYVTAIRAVLSDMGNWSKMIGYALGFATGLVIGLTLEDRLGLGFTHYRIISPGFGLLIASNLRKANFAVTEVSAKGLNGVVQVLHCNVLHKHDREVERIIIDTDPDAFVTAENIRRIDHGFWRTKSNADA